MKKYLLLTSVILVICVVLCSCAPIRRPLDNRTGFSEYLTKTETHIRNEKWENASTDMENAFKTWKKLKPFLQLDIDHDYVNIIESNFVLLRGYIETREKPDALAIILLIQDTWQNIDSM